MKKIYSGEKYLTFFLQEEEYCISIHHVKEIIGMPEITRMPQTPDFIQGVINLRGTIIPVIDLRLRLELPFKDYGMTTCVIVLDFEIDGVPTQMGIVVDETNEVLAIPEETVTKIPYISSKIRSEYIFGVVEMKDKLKILLDITKVLGEEEFVSVQSFNQGEKPHETEVQNEILPTKVVSHTDINKEEKGEDHEE